MLINQGKRCGCCTLRHRKDLETSASSDVPDRTAIHTAKKINGKTITLQPSEGL